MCNSGKTLRTLSYGMYCRTTAFADNGRYVKYRPNYPAPQQIAPDDNAQLSLVKGSGSLCVKRPQSNSNRLRRFAGYAHDAGSAILKIGGWRRQSVTAGQPVAPPLPRRGNDAGGKQPSRSISPAAVSPATVMGPVWAGFSHGHGTTRLPVMGPPGVSLPSGCSIAGSDRFTSIDVEEVRWMFREVSVIEVVEVLRCWLSGAGFRRVAALAGVDRKTVRRYVAAAEAAGLDRDGGVDQLTDELIGQVVAAVRPDRPQGHGTTWEALQANHARIEKWVKEGLTVVKIADLLGRDGVLVPQRTLHRYCTQCTEYRGRRDTVPVADGEPGVECQIDFARMGMIFDSQTGRPRVVHALIFTAVYSRHMFVWLTFSQTLEAIIAGCEAAWWFFGGYAGVDTAVCAQAA